MSVAALIAEFNPFHNGHEYIVRKAKEITGAEHLVVIMSGDYVQRGAPAITDKWSRAEMALRHGADMVLEIPVRYASASAPFFSYAGVLITKKLGFIDYLCFGVEDKDILENDPITDINQKDKKTYLAPNDILATLYKEALNQLKSDIKCVPIERISGESIESASNIRDMICNSDCRNYLPIDVLEKRGILKVDESILDEALYIAIKSIIDEGESISEKLCTFSEVTEGIAGRIIAEFPEFKGFKDFIQRVKVKQYTYTRVSRALLHIALGIKKTEDELTGLRDAKDLVKIEAVRLLGAYSSATHLLKESNIRIVTKVSDYLTSTEEEIRGNNLSEEKKKILLARQMIIQDINAGEMYTNLARIKGLADFEGEYKSPIIIK